MGKIHELFEIRTYMLGIGIVAACLKLGMTAWDFYGRELCSVARNLDSVWSSFWS